MTNDRLLRILEKRANFAAMVNSAKAAVTANPAIATGAALGGLYGGYRGTQGPDAGVGTALLGAASGALGGGLIGAAGQGIARGLGAGGQPNVFKQIRTTRAAAADAARAELGTAAVPQGGFLSNVRNIRNARAANKQYADVTQGMANADMLAQHGLLTPAAARAEIDALAASNPYHAYEAAKKKLTYGTLGAGMAVGTGAGLMGASGVAASDPTKTAHYSAIDRLCAQLRGV